MIYRGIEKNINKIILIEFYETNISQHTRRNLENNREKT